MSQFRNTPEQARRLWIEDLLSGPPQTETMQCRLNQDGDPIGWCCLGRACEVCLAHEGPLFEKRKDIRNRMMLYANGRSASLPDIVREWLGLRSDWGDYESPHDSLTSQNDSGATFADIARLIESAPPGLFVEELSHA